MPDSLKRTILHCDCNNYFASVELLDRPDLRDMPVAVAGDPEGRHGIILAKNMIAKKAGVVTAEPIWQARQKCPGLILLPPHHEKYEKLNRRINAIYQEVSDQVEAFSIDESWLDVTGSRALFGNGVEIADMLRRRVREEVGVTISVGVSDNKTWAKMGSDYKKPDATTLITRQNVSDILWPMAVDELLFVGHASAERLRSHGIATIGALAACSRETLVSWLGKQGDALWRMANGADDAPVRRFDEHEPVKSVGKGFTFPHDLVGREACHAGILPLCDSVAFRLRRAGMKCRTVTLQIKNPQLKVISRQKKLDMPTCLTHTIYQAACELLHEAWPENAPVRLMTVTASSLVPADTEVPAQLSFLDEVKPDDPKRLKLEETIDAVRSRYGRDAVHHATPKIT